ncbi:MAG: hypothetical protein D8M58_21390 [Calditrichaeota bacterium]|nr:MAG: hypothetical protein DWQ03_00115 [Calditrichota bacterium]MBL1207968.1 hypothetical protein [Calditrichota bacterium]NOG47804.1 hypothetical protein [Calditrichota bacterium]
MELSNFKEYRFLRTELQNLKNCITNYMGFVLGGSGLSFIAFQLLSNKGPLNTEYVAQISLILSIVISLVLSIIFYKFNSHNRYAGYCKLLNQEHINIKTTAESLDLIRDIDIESWEICVNRLRHSDFEDKPFKNLYEGYHITDVITQDLQISVEYYSGRNNAADKHRFWKGILLIFELIVGRVNTRSWQFPLFVTGIFAILVLIYLIASLYFYSHVYTFDLEQGTFNASNIAYIALFLLLLRIWYTFICKLFSLLKGGASVDAFCWKFLPIRYSFLRHKFPYIKYSLITLSDGLKEFEEQRRMKEKLLNG